MSFLFTSLSKASTLLFNSFKNIQTSIIENKQNLIGLSQIRGLGYINRMMLKDIKRREMLKKYSPTRLRLQTLRKNSILPKNIRKLASEELQKLPRMSNIAYVHQRCQLTSKAGGVFERWRLSRIQLRLLADYNHLSGWTRATWGTPTRNSICFTYKKYRPPWFNTQRHSKRTVFNRYGEKNEINFRYPCG